MSAAARATSARATGESVEKIGIAASLSGVSMPYQPSLRGVEMRARCAGAFAALSSCRGRPALEAFNSTPRRASTLQNQKRPPGGRPSRIGICAPALGGDRLRPCAAIAGEAEAQEAEQHHRPSRWLWDRRRKPKDFIVEFVADDLVRIGGRMVNVVIEIGIRRRARRLEIIAGVGRVGYTI